MITLDDLRRDATPVDLRQVPPARVKRAARRIWERYGLHVESEDQTPREEESILLLLRHIE